MRHCLWKKFKNRNCDRFGSAPYRDALKLKRIITVDLDAGGQGFSERGDQCYNTWIQSELKEYFVSVGSSLERSPWIEIWHRT